MLIEKLNSLKAAKKIKPTMKIHAHMSTSNYFDSDFDKQELSRLKDEIKALEDHIKGFDRDKAADQVHKSLKADLLSKKARHAELKARL